MTASRSSRSIRATPRRAAGRGARAGRAWTVMQRVDHPDPAAANAQALHDLENGATGLTLVCAGSINANGYGLDGSPETLERVLDGVYLDAGVAIDFNVAAETRDAAKNFAALVKKRGIAPETVEMRASLNPLGHMAATGSNVRPWRRSCARPSPALIGELAAEGFRGPFAVADGRVIHNAGGSEAQELAFALGERRRPICARSKRAASRSMPRGGMIYFRLAADADQFLTIAKFRAMRKLWARVEQACGLAPRPAYVSAETAWRMMTRRDPYVNMLRTTIAVFAAGLGGADAITVLPFTAALGLPDRFARRIARNTQLILLEESNLAKVADPAAGSGGIEDLTRAALRAPPGRCFRRSRRPAARPPRSKQGLIQRKVAATRAEREKKIARRKDALTGTSEFPDLHEARGACARRRAACHATQPANASLARRCRASASPSRSRRCAMPPTACSPRPARGRKSSSPISASSPTSRARTLSPRTSSRPAASRRSRTTASPAATRWSRRSRRPARSSPACARPTRSMRREAVDAAKALSAAGAAHIYLAGRPGTSKPRSRPPACRTSSTSAATCWRR